MSNEIVANGGLNGSYATITTSDGVKLENVPVIVQPGQAVGTVGLALGYGRKAAMKEEMMVGINAYPLYRNFNNIQSITLENAGGEHEFACVQGQKTLMGRGDIIKETSLEIFNTENAEIWNKQPVVSLDHKEVQATTVDFDSGSSKMNNPPAVKPGKHQKKKVWVPTHRSNGRLIKGHYVWR